MNVPLGAAARPTGRGPGLDRGARRTGPRPDAGYLRFFCALDLVFGALRKPGRAAASVGRVRMEGGAVVRGVAGVVGLASGSVLVSSDMRAAYRGGRSAARSGGGSRSSRKKALSSARPSTPAFR